MGEKAPKPNLEDDIQDPTAASIRRVLEQVTSKDNPKDTKATVAQIQKDAAGNYPDDDSDLE